MTYMAGTRLSVRDLPEADFQIGTPLAPQLADIMKRLLKLHGQGPSSAVLMPPVTALAKFYQVHEMDVLDALLALKRQHYEYRLQGLDQPFAFRQAAQAERWQELNRELLKPADPVYQRTGFPLWNMPGPGRL